MKIALIYARKKSAWRSCQTITENLVSLYQNLFAPEEIFTLNYQSGITDFELWHEALELVKKSPEKIVITDHTPHPYLLFLAMDRIYHENKNPSLPEIIIHVFGDFTLYAKEWIKSEKILKKYKVKFVCASQRQARLIQSFLVSSIESIFVCPFPVDSQQFYFSPLTRAELRKANNIDEDTTVFVYTGRLSKQKNVVELIQSFAKFVELQDHKVKLLLAGPFDDLGSPFVGYVAKERYEQTCLRIIESLQKSESTRNKILYIGNLGAQKLLELYQVADVYVSLSAHNDEDFGMAPAEALCTGLPAILTNWAGYASFKNPSVENYCQLISVEMKEGFIDFNRSEFLHSLIDTCENIQKIKMQREKLALLNQEQLCLETCQKKVEGILKKEVSLFAGFSELLYEMEIAFQRAHSPFGVVTHQFNYTDLYKRIYQSYVSTES